MIEIALLTSYLLSLKVILLVIYLQFFMKIPIVKKRNYQLENREKKLIQMKQYDIILFLWAFVSGLNYFYRPNFVFNIFTILWKNSRCGSKFRTRSTSTAAQEARPTPSYL